MSDKVLRLAGARGFIRPRQLQRSEVESGDGDGDGDGPGPGPGSLEMGVALFLQAALTMLPDVV